jgi:hypothetical protein
VEWSPQASEASKDEQLLFIEDEVNQFSHYLESLTDVKAQGPLNKPERALVTTYLVAKLRGKI